AFVGEKGNLVLKYVRDQAQVRLNERSIFQVTEELPVNTKLDRKIGLTGALGGTRNAVKSKSDQELESFLSEYFTEARPNKDNAPSFLGDSEADNISGGGIDLEWRVTEQPVRYPLGVMNIRSLSFPTKFSLVLEKQSKPTKMFAYL